MKEMTSTSVTNPKATFVCSTLLNDLFDDDCRSRFDFTWDSRKCRESSFALFRHRDRSIEFRLSMVNTLIMDYHLHRRENVCYNDEEGYWVHIEDDNPQESEAVLMKAKEIVELTMEYIFKAGQAVHVDYALLAMSLLHKIYGELEYFNKYFEPKKELKHLLKRSMRA